VLVIVVVPDVDALDVTELVWDVVTLVVAVELTELVAVVD